MTTGTQKQIKVVGSKGDVQVNRSGISRLLLFLERHHKGLEVFMGIVLAVSYGIFLAVIVAVKFFTSGPIEVPTTDTAISQADLVVQASMKDGTWVMVWTSGILGIASIGLSLVVFFYSRRQGQVSQWHSEQSLRAYIHTDIEAVRPDTLTSFIHRVTGIPNPPPGVGYIIKIKNHGQTPAFHLSTFGKVTVSKYPIPKENDFPSEMDRGYLNSLNSTATLGPTAEVTMLVDMKTLSTEQVENVKADNEVLYVYGEINYEDCFGKSHVTKFRYSHHLDHSKSYGKDLASHFHGNEAN